MIWIIIAFIAITLIFFLLLKLKQKAGSYPQQHTYNKIDSLFTPAERSFLGVLNQAIEDNAFVFGKVRVADENIGLRVKTQNLDTGSSSL